MNKWMFLLLLFFLRSAFLQAQTNVQLWGEYMLNYSFANSFNLENAFVYSTLMDKPKWRAYDYSATLEWSVTGHMDLIGATTLSYTNQDESYNTLEIRPLLGTRLYLTPYKRIQTRLLLRVEQRNFQNLDTKEWNQQYRPRVRAEVIAPVNKRSFYEDRLWYVITDFELLLKTDDVEERFANRLRWRIGAGYRLAYNLRFEFIYMLQQSKNTIDEDFQSSDNIFRFRVRQYLRKTMPSKTTGVGN